MSADHLVQVLCSCGRVHRLPSRTRKFRCQCYMNIFLANGKATQTSWDGSQILDLTCLPAPDNAALTVDTSGEHWFQLPPSPKGGERDSAWKEEMLGVLERVAELEEALYQKTQQLAERERELETVRANEEKYREALLAVKPIVEDWYTLESENARLARLMQVQRAHGRVNVEELFRRAEFLRNLDRLRVA